MSEDKTVTITKKQFEALMSRLESVESGRTIKKPQRVRDHIAYLRTLEGKLIIKYGTAEEKFNKNTTKWELKLPVYQVGESEPVVVDYMSFLNDANQVQVKIIKQVAVERVESAGLFPKRDIKTDNILPGDEIELEVRYVDYEVDVEILEGEQKGTVLTVSTTALNA